jgi:uncharacterized Zn finger protein (UPF0148 family)
MSVECQNCGAAVELPVDGLELRCGFCGHAQPVPGADERRRRLEEEQREREEAEVERRLKEVELEEREQRLAAARAEERRKKLSFYGSLPGRILRGLVKVGLPIVVLGLIAHQTGFLNAWIGDPGTLEFAALRDRLAAEGFAPILSPEVKALYFEKRGTHPLALQPGYCYAFAAGARRPIWSAAIFDTTGKAADATTSPSTGQLVAHCPRAAGTYTAGVDLESSLGGRYTAQWFFRLAPPPPAAIAPARRPVALPAATITAPAKKPKLKRAKRAP